MGYGRYGRRYPGGYRRRLSNRSVFGKTSAKSQAKQIAALRNRVTSIWKACRPEIKTIVSQAHTQSFTSESTSSYYKFLAMSSPDQGLGDKDRIGNFVRVINGVLYLSCEYFNSSVSGYHNGESSGAQVRIVIGQCKSQTPPGTTPIISQIFEYPGNTGANYTQMALSPLKEGISNSNYILADKRYTLTSDFNQKMLKIPYKPLAPFEYDESGNYPLVWVCIIVTGLHYDQDFTETVKITHSDKLVFTDA